MPDRTPLTQAQVVETGDDLLKRALESAGETAATIERRTGLPTRRYVLIDGGRVMVEYAEYFFQRGRYLPRHATGNVIIKTESSDRFSWRKPAPFPARTFKPLKATGEVNLKGLGEHIANVCRVNARIEATKQAQKNNEAEGERKRAAICAAHPVCWGSLDIQGSSVRLTVTFEDENDAIAVLDLLKQQALARRK